MTFLFEKNLVYFSCKWGHWNIRTEISGSET